MGPRLIVIAMDQANLPALALRVRHVLTLDPRQSFESVTATTRWSLTAVSGAFEIELFELSDDPYDRERFTRRRSVEVFGIPTFAATAEDVVVQKLRWARRGRRTKDIEDALNVLLVSGDQLDWPYIRRRCDEHGSRKSLESLRVQAGLTV